MSLDINAYMKMIAMITDEVPSSSYGIAYGTISKFGGEPGIHGQYKIEPEDLPIMFEGRQKQIDQDLENKIEDQPVQKELTALLSESNHPLASAALERIIMLEVQLEDLRDLMQQQRDNFKDELVKKQEKMNKIKAQAEKSNLRSYLAKQR